MRGKLLTEKNNEIQSNNNRVELGFEPSASYLKAEPLYQWTVSGKGQH